MDRSIAWQLAYRGLMGHQVTAAAAAAVAASGAADAKDMHVTIEVKYFLSDRPLTACCALC
jgi:hypothetical protein